MGGGNPFMPPPGGTGSGGAPVGGGPTRGGPPVAAGPGAARLLGGNRVPGPGVRGTGASILAPAPPDQPPNPNAGPNVPPSQQGQLFADVHQTFKQVKAQYEQGQQAQQVLDHLRVELDQLMEMGDIVRPDDVIESAGRLVGHGIGATQLATIMSDMPAQGGEGLASWVRMHDLSITNAEQALAHETALMRHRLGVEALRSMAATHLDERTKEAPGGAASGGARDMAAPGGGGMDQAMMPPSGMAPAPMAPGGDMSMGNDLGGDMGNGESNA